MPYKTTDLCDQYGNEAEVFEPIFRDFGGKADFEGKAFTVKCFEDNSRIKELSLEPGKGRILVVDGGGSNRCALFGDVIGEDLVKNGWAGAVIYGYVRDSAVLKTLPIAIKALGVSPRKSVKRSEGQCGERLVFAGVVVQPGDQLFADEDGIIKLNRELS